MDPAASEFISRFLALTRDTHLAHLAALADLASAALAAALTPITEPQWNMLKLYLLNLVATFGEEAYAEMAASKPFIPAAVQAAVQAGLGGSGAAARTCSYKGHMR